MAFVSNFTQKVTHLIVQPTTDSNGKMIAKRTVKYLKALLQGAHVVHYSWILDSIVNNKIVRESDYMVDGDELGLGTPAKMVISKGNRQLFAGRVFAFVGVVPPVGIGQVDVSELVIMGGGSVAEGDKANDEATFRIVITTRTELPLYETTKIKNFIKNRSYFSHKMILDAISLNTFSESSFKLAFY